MDRLTFLLTPLLGSLIGYITNSLAVKMLFRPYRSLYIGKFHIPFTPGMIPKRQGELSASMGKMVQDHLLTSEEIQNKLLSESVRSGIIAEVSSAFFSALKGATIQQVLTESVGSSEAERIREHTAEWISRRILSEIHSMDLDQLLVQEIQPFIEKNLGALAVLFMSGNAVESISGAAADRIREVLDTDGERLLQPLVEKEIQGLSDLDLDGMLSDSGISQEQIILSFTKIYDRVVSRDLGNVFSALDVASIVEDRINRMDVRELEDLIFSIMKRELNAIVNLGGLIGFVLGCLSLLF